MTLIWYDNIYILEENIPAAAKEYSMITGKAFILHRKLSEGAPDINAKAVFKEMMEQELKHVDYLKKMGGRLA